MLMNFKVDESTRGWRDAWSPTEEIIRSNFHVLADPRVTRVNGIDFDNELLSCQLSNNDEMVHSMPDLSVNCATLKERVENQLSRPGHVHWGTNLDITHLSKVLNIGFIVFPNDNENVLSTRGWIFGISDTRADCTRGT